MFSNDNRNDLIHTYTSFKRFSDASSSVRPSVRLALVSSLALGFYASNPAHSSRICQSILKPLKQLSFFPLFFSTTKQSFRYTHEIGDRYGSPYTKIKISCVGDQNSSSQANIVHIVANTALWFKTENKYRGGTPCLP